MGGLALPMALPVPAAAERPGGLPFASAPNGARRVVTTAEYRRATDAIREALGLSNRVMPDPEPGPEPDPEPSDADAAYRTVMLQRVAALLRTMPFSSATLRSDEGMERPARLPDRSWTRVVQNLAPPPADVPPPPPPPLPAPPPEPAEPRQPLARGLCCVCMDERHPCEVVFTGCGHMHTCLPCAQRLVARAQLPDREVLPCPLCRTIGRPLLVRTG